MNSFSRESSSDTTLCAWSESKRSFTVSVKYYQSKCLNVVGREIVVGELTIALYPSACMRVRRIMQLKAVTFEGISAG